jgi:hypothetical protein
VTIWKGKVSPRTLCLFVHFKFKQKFIYIHLIPSHWESSQSNIVHTTVPQSIQMELGNGPSIRFTLGEKRVVLKSNHFHFIVNNVIFNSISDQCSYFKIDLFSSLSQLKLNRCQCQTHFQLSICIDFGAIKARQIQWVSLSVGAECRCRYGCWALGF